MLTEDPEIQYLNILTLLPCILLLFLNFSPMNSRQPTAGMIALIDLEGVLLGSPVEDLLLMQAVLMPAVMLPWNYLVFLEIDDFDA